MINISFLLPSTSLLPFVNQFFYTFSLYCASSTVGKCPDKRPSFILSCLFFIPHCIYKEARLESTFSIDIYNYIWQLPSLNSFHFITVVSKNKKHSSNNLVSFRASSFLKFAFGFRVYQEISIYIVVIYTKSSGNRVRNLDLTTVPC